MSLDFHHQQQAAAAAAYNNQQSQQQQQSQDLHFDQDFADHASYGLFSSSEFSRFRAPSYPSGQDMMYAQPSFTPDSSASFQPPSTPQYDIMGYPNGDLAQQQSQQPQRQQSYPFPQNGTAYSDIMDRRASSTSYRSDFSDDFAAPPHSAGLHMNGFGQHLSYAPPQLTHHRHSPELLRGVVPGATHSSHAGAFDDLSSHFGIPPLDVDETLRRMKLQPTTPLAGPSSATDLQSFVRPYLDQYVRAPNRLAFGERTVIVMSSKVAQKSYGTEKRFLCPPPTAIMIGNSWWSEVHRRGEDPKSAPPRVVVSISGEPVPSEGTIEWTSASGKTFDVSDPPTGTTYLGRCVGKQLYISDVDEKKKKVEALVKITAPASDDEPERIIGVFPSKPIKVISKPSKKRQSAKNLELCINHGSTISLFHRLRSQTVSTKYLCVSGSGSAFKGSDGAPLMGIDQRSRQPTPSFIARTASWDPFVMYIVDVNKPAGGIDAPPPPPPQPDYPSPPPNAIPFTNNGSPIPIYYNQTVVLQCLTSGVVSPVLIIRKVDHRTNVVGGGLAEGAKNVADHFCTPGEVCGDPVSQLHKIAFEVYDASKGHPEPGTPGITGAFLSCMGEKVNTYRPVDGRQWVVPQQSSSRGSDSPQQVPSTPINGSMIPNAGDYFGSPTTASAPASPTLSEFPPSSDGGRVKRGKRSTSSVGSSVSKVSKGRRRQNSTGSGSSRAGGSNGDSSAASGALWQVDIGEMTVWTIVGTDQVRYNFYVPPVLFDAQTPSANASGTYPIPSRQVTPFPGVVKYLPPDRAAEVPKANCPQSRAGAITKPNPHASKMLTVYGENFSKTEPVTVFFGSEPSPYVEVRCTEVLGCLPPENPAAKRRPLILVRPDGVVFPSSVMYP